MSDRSFHTILTHPGSAHKDDFLACCVLLASSPAAIERREPTQEDLENPQIAVIDVGHQHDADKGNFDHHQFSRDQAPTCSLSLVLKHLGLYEDAKIFCEWLEPAEWFDCRGPKDTAAWLGVEREIIGKLNSPIDITLLRRFALSGRHEPSEPIWEIMRMVGQDLVDYLASLRQRLQYIDLHSEFWEIDGPDGLPRKFLFIPRIEPLPDEPSAGIGQFLKSIGLEDAVVGTICPDRRSTGYGLSRHNDNLALDFTRVEAEPDVHFAHKGGFVAKTTATEGKRLKELLKLALV